MAERRMFAKTKRKIAMKNSSLPYSFGYKMRLAFLHKICPVCGCVMEGNKYSNNNLPSIQHNVPISLGGKHELDNISIICRSCNESLRDTTTGKLNNEEVKRVWNGIIEGSIRV